MANVAFLLVLASAFIHALWNLAAKGAGGGFLFFWMFSLFEVLVYAPIVLWLNTPLSPWGIFFMTGSALIHVVYFGLLLYGYRIGDLSLVYPISRGIGPIFSVFGAMLLFSEAPTPMVIIGAIIISSGAILLTGDPRQLRNSTSLPAIGYGLLIAFSISAYTLWDSWAVKQVSVQPLVYLWWNSVLRCLFLFPYAWSQRQQLRTAWVRDWRYALVVGTGSPGGYALFLVAASLADVSYISPLRTLSILFGVLLGVNLFKERDQKRRILGAGVIVLGVILLNLKIR